MKRLPLVFNGRSGVGAKDPDALMARLPEELRAKLEPMAFGPPWDFEPLIAQAQAAEGPLLVWGGDGTLHHAGRALAAAGCPVPLAAIPGGSGNGLVRGLRTPLEPAGAVMRLLSGRELRMDLPRLDGMPFLNVCGTGFEAVVAHAFDGMKGRGFLSYLKLCLRLMRSEQPFPVQWETEVAPALEAPGRVARLKAAWNGEEPALPESVWSLCFANLPQYGSGCWIAPDADPTDGILQWARIKKPGPMDLLFSAPELFREGGRTHLREVGRILQATVSLDRPRPWHLDGEPVAARDRAELSLERGAFRMQVTESCPF